MRVLAGGPDNAEAVRFHSLHQPGDGFVVDLFAALTPGFVGMLIARYFGPGTLRVFQNCKVWLQT